MLRLKGHDQRMRAYYCFDRATQVYLVVVAGLMLLFRNPRIDLWPWLVGAHAAGLVLLAIVVRAGSCEDAPPWVRFIRHVYPVVFMGLFYRESEYLNQMVVDGYLDPEVIRLEAALFGGQPSLAFMDRLPWLPLSELFYASYFSFYLMIGGMAVYLYLRDRAELRHFMSVMSVVSFGCYFCFLFLPIIGPRLFFGEIHGYALPPAVMPEVAPVYPISVQSGLFYRIMTLVYEHLEGAGGSVPSSHVAVAICTLCFSFRYARPVRHVHLVLVILLSLATVYCRYHYLVDLLTGLVAAAVLIPLGEWCHHRCAPPGRSRSGN